MTARELAQAPQVARPDETLRHVADRMLTGGHGVLPVVSGENGTPVGIVSQFDLLAASSS